MNAGIFPFQMMAFHCSTKVRFFGVLLALSVAAGCASAPSLPEPDALARVAVYQPLPSPTRTDASASIDVEHEVTAELRTAWKKGPRTDQAVEAYRRTVDQAITDDLAKAGLFARIVADGGVEKPDYAVAVRSQLARPNAGLVLRVRVYLQDGSTGAKLGEYARDASLGGGLEAIRGLPATLQRMMAGLKGELARDVARLRQDTRDKAMLAEMAVANLADLLVASDRNDQFARERNRAIIAAKTRQLDGLLRNSKTSELTALLVRVEQTILDLNHECELAKDQAQQAVADGGTARRPARVPNSGMEGIAGSSMARMRGGMAPAAQGPGIDELRSLAISYRERIELLKPIAAAIKEELANRNQ